MEGLNVCAPVMYTHCVCGNLKPWGKTFREFRVALLLGSRALGAHAARWRCRLCMYTCWYTSTSCQSLTDRHAPCPQPISSNSQERYQNLLSDCVWPLKISSYYIELGYVTVKFYSVVGTLLDNYIIFTIIYKCCVCCRPPTGKYFLI